MFVSRVFTRSYDMKKKLGKTTDQERKTARGPLPDRLSIDVPFDVAADRMVKAKKPASGWPRPGRKKKAPGKKPKA